MTVRYELVETAISMEGCCGQENVYGIAAYDEDGNRIFTWPISALIRKERVNW